MSKTVILQEDFSCELQKALAYLDFIHNYLGIKQRHEELDITGIRLSPNDVNALGWMLVEAGTVVHQINAALYGGKGDTTHE